MKNVLTHAVGNPDDRQNKLCRCGTCGVVSRCQPDFDFYGSNGEPLKCERCFRDELAKEGLKLVHAEPGDVIGPEPKAPLCPLGTSEAARADWKKHAARLVHAKVNMMLRVVEERLLKHKHGVKVLPEATLRRMRARALALAEALKLIEATNRKLRI